MKSDTQIRRRYAARAAFLLKQKPLLPAGSISMSAGFGFPNCLPDVSKEAVIAATTYRTETMNYSDVFGIEDMRDFVVNYVAQDGVRCKRENVLITNGAKHGLDLACRVFVEPGDTVIVTSPMYMTALHILRTFQVNWLIAGQDEDGLDAELLERQLAELEARGQPLPKLLFDVPDFHNPTGITTAAHRRKKLVELAERYNFIIVEDDPYRRVRFEGEAVPPVKSYDERGVVVALGTVSKILAPGLRIGWVIADEDVIRRMASQKSDLGSSALTQRIVVEMNRNGLVDHHYKEITGVLRNHRDVMLSALATHLPAAKIRKPDGGYYLWAEFPEFVNSDVLAGLGVKHGVNVYTGAICFPVDPKKNFMRFSFSFTGPDEIVEGAKRLSLAYDEYCRGLDASTEQRMIKEGQNMQIS